MAKKAAICRVIGCGRELSAANATGVCLAHNHAPGACGCIQCRETKRAGEAPPPIRSATPAAVPSGRKVVHVPYATSNSGVNLTAPITLPRAPWEDRN